MASTTQTTNYGLPIYQQSDKASWVDTNEPFNAIDTALKGAVTLGESLSPVVAQNTSNIATLQTDLTAVTADVNTIKNTTLPAMQNAIDGAETAAGTSYNNTDSGLAATNVQNAIDEAVLDNQMVVLAINSNNNQPLNERLHTFYDTIHTIASSLDGQFLNIYIPNRGYCQSTSFPYHFTSIQWNETAQGVPRMVITGIHIATLADNITIAYYDIRPSSESNPVIASLHNTDTIDGNIILYGPKRCLKAIS